MTMAEKIEDLTLDYEEEGVVVRKTIDKHVLTKGAWSTVAFLYTEVDRKSGQMGAAKMSVRRYRKRDEKYREDSKFSISSANQARQLAELIGKWFPAEE